MASMIKGPGIFLAQFLRDEEPYNSLDGIGRWVADLGYKGIQVPTFDPRVFDLEQAAESQTYCDDLRGRLQEIGLGFLDLLLEARKSSAEQRRELLRRADIELDKLRYTVRLSHALELLGPTQYRRASELLSEVGKLLGTWIKGYNKRESS